MLKLLKTGFAGLAVVGATVAPAALAAEEYPELTFRYASGFPESLYMSGPAIYFAEELEKRSGGKIKMRMFHGGALGKANEILDLVSKGAIDAGALVQGYFTSALPFASMTNSLPMTFFDGEKAMRVSMELDATDPNLIEEYERNNIKPLINRFLPNYKLICTSEIRTVDDFAGKKIRTFGNFMPKMFDALKATPVNVLPNDMYEALKRGSMDCSYLTTPFFVQYKLYEVAPYVIDVKLGGINAYFMAFNKRKFDSLPQNVQDLLVDIGRDATEYGVKQTYEVEATAMDEVKAAGATVVPFQEQEKLEEVVPDMIPLWIEEMAKVGKEAEAKEYAAKVKTKLGL